MKVYLCILSFLSVCSSLAYTSVSPVPADVLPAHMDGAGKRNVVFILSDDHRYDAMSFMGHPFAETPHLDSLAANGVHLKNAFVTTSLCSPSRASILTGLYTFRHQVIDNQRLVPEGTLFFPQYLQKAGFKTGFVGKWHMGAHNDDPRPGFDFWVSFRGQGHYYPPNENYTLNKNGQRVPQDGYITTFLTEQALEFLDQQKDQEEPFFLYLSHKAVHSNFTPEPKYEGSFGDKPFEKPASERKLTENSLNRPRWLLDQRNSWHGVDFPYHSDADIDYLYRRYCEALSSVDDSVGAVLDKLKEMGIYDQTLVIYMGDNGFMFGEHGLIDKRVAYETSIRVPMLMQCPELFEAGSEVEEVVANIDIAPTVMEAMGLKKPRHMDGESFIPLAEGREIPWRDYFLYVYYWEKNFPQTPTQFSLRGDRFKYTTYYGLWDTDEFFDIRADPTEQHNLIYDPNYEEQILEMENRLYAMMEDMGGDFVPLRKPSAHRRNKRLGQIGGDQASDFPGALVLDKPERSSAD
ncbi:sulfatase [Pelagicoccus sp. SDUM812002]|uniref:sulfatase family protein n=1 Tax=Pelagicoccus sp. SDUM812002 TaxID=3041266 RepID=UPI0028101B24|nr:sulfatase [Pelagicoccus sp. SDUM812002]MDQ8185674.1 sulfatase [Pelagicoccus sp. SDUM812002]